MGDIFRTVLNMSLTGAFVIAALLVARLALSKIRAPRWVSYALWAVAGFRLAFPFSIESAWSLVPRQVTGAFTDAPQAAFVPMGYSIANPLAVSNATTTNGSAAWVTLPGLSADAVSGSAAWVTLSDLIAFAWLLGAAAMAAYSVISIIRLRRRLRGAAYIDGNLYEHDDLKTPFVLGLFSPKIYIPTGLPQNERRYVILHEQAHIKRGDHIAKFAAYLLLCVHWFNPLAWAAFFLMGADMEMSCDERVLREMNEGDETKAAYSMSLLNFATGRRIISGSPLAFGEGGVKERVRNVLNFKKPSRMIVLAAVLLAVALSAGFGLNKASAETKDSVSASTDAERVIHYGNGGTLYYGDTRSFDVAWRVFPGDTPERAVPLYEAMFDRPGLTETLTRDEAAELAAFYLSVFYDFVPGHRTFEVWPTVMNETQALWTIYVTALDGEDAQNGYAAQVTLDAVTGLPTQAGLLREDGAVSPGYVKYPGWDDNAPDLAPYETTARQLAERTGILREITEVTATLAGRVNNNAPATEDSPFLVQVTVTATDGGCATFEFVTGQEQPAYVQFGRTSTTWAAATSENGEMVISPAEEGQFDYVQFSSKSGEAPAYNVTTVETPSGMVEITITDPAWSFTPANSSGELPAATD